MKEDERYVIYLCEDLDICRLDELLSFDWKYKDKWLPMSNSTDYINCLNLLGKERLIDEEVVSLKKGYYNVDIDEESWDIRTENFTFYFIENLDGFPHRLLKTN